MRFRKLGEEGPDITTVGFGAWAIGGPWKFGWGAVDDAESAAAIRHAIESGINWVDTAAVYGLGHSEEVVGRAVSPFDVGSEVFVFTKCGRSWYASNGDDVVNDLRPESIRFECEQSLKRMRLECIDLYQFHWADFATGTALEESWATMLALIDEGKIRWAGVCNFNVELLERCSAVRHVDSAQPPLSMLKRGARTEIIPWCLNHGTGVIVYSPMQSGLLTGAFDATRLESLSDDDWRRRSPDFQEPNFSTAVALVDRLRPIADEVGCSLAELAIAWTLAVPGVTGAIVGARSPRQVDGWIEAADLDLSEETLNEIAVAIDATGAGSDDAPVVGPRR